MSFVPKKHTYNAHINEVVLGVGDKAVTIGGQNVLAFHTFDGEITNAPKIGVELTDAGMAMCTMPGEQHAAGRRLEQPVEQHRQRAFAAAGDG